MHRQTRRQLGGEAAATRRTLPLADDRAEEAGRRNRPRRDQPPHCSRCALPLRAADVSGVRRGMARAVRAACAAGDARELPRLAAAARCLRRMAARDDRRCGCRRPRLRGWAASAASRRADARHDQDDPAQREGARPDHRRRSPARAAAAPGARRDEIPRLERGRAPRLRDRRALRQPRPLCLPHGDAAGRAVRPSRPGA